MSTVFFRDNFVDDDGTLLSDHAPDLGIAWARNSSSVQDVVIQDSEATNVGSTNSFVIYQADASPEAGTYRAKAVVRQLPGQPGEFWAGACVRVQTSRRLYYAGTGQFALPSIRRVTTGALNTLLVSFSGAPSYIPSGESWEFTLEAEGTALLGRLLTDEGDEYIAETVDGTNPVTGSPGIIFHAPEGRASISYFEASYGEEGGGELESQRLESRSELNAPALTQAHQLSPAAIESASGITAPSLAQSSALIAADIESAAELSAPALAQMHSLAPAGLDSASNITAPALSQSAELSALPLESRSQVGVPGLAQDHRLSASSVEAGSEITAPALSSQPGVHHLIPRSLASVSEISGPVLGQIHALTPAGIEAAGEITAPELEQPDHGHHLVGRGLDSRAEAIRPALAQVHHLVPRSIAARAEASRPVLGGQPAELGSAVLYEVPAEDRIFTAPSEIRVFAVPAEDRIITVLERRTA